MFAMTSEKCSYFGMTNNLFTYTIFLIIICSFLRVLNFNSFNELQYNHVYDIKLYTIVYMKFSVSPGWYHALPHSLVLLPHPLLLNLLLKNTVYNTA